MDKEKMIELLEKNVVFWDNEGEGLIAQMPRDDYDQLLVLLKEQPPVERDYPNLEFIKVQRAAAQRAIEAYEQDEECCPTKTTRLLEACDRLGTSEASRKELLAALEKYGDHETGCIKGDACNCGLKKAIEKGKG